MPGFRTYVGSRLSPLAGQPLMVALTMTLLAGAPRAEACTTMLVSAGASKTGVPMLAHTVDCWDCDNRVALVPSRDHAADEEHHVFGIGHQYPRITSDKRAWIYRPQPGEVRAARGGEGGGGWGSGGILARTASGCGRRRSIGREPN